MAKTSLWNFYDGEPFMENPHLAIVGNPFKVGSVVERKRSGFKKIGQKKGRKVMAYRKRRGRKATSRRRRARRNPFPVAGIAVNPRRRRRRTYTMRRNKRGVYAATNPRRRKRYGRRRARRNPAVLGVMLPPIQMIAWGAAGFLAPPMVEAQLNKFLPAEITGNTLGRYAVKIGSVIGLTWLTKAVLGTKEAFPVALGGSLYVVVSAVNEFAPQLVTVPAPGVSAYRTGMIRGVDAYRTGMINVGVGQYSRANLARPMPGLAQSQGSRWNLGTNGMKNPTQADPRFVDSIAR